MSAILEGAMKVRFDIERWPLAVPFRISGYTFEVAEVLVTSLEKDGRIGRGEASGVYYRQDTPVQMLRQLESARSKIEIGLGRDEVQRLLPPGGARNALDCAVWDLEAKLSGQPVWRLAELEPPRSLLTTFTCGADEPEIMAARARTYDQARAIKVKLIGDELDAERVRYVRGARPDVWLGVDGNQGFTRARLEKLMPVLVDARVQLIEQPFPIGADAFFQGLKSPIPLAADESAQTLADVRSLVPYFQVINIKLDKCGGLTEGLAMARLARDLGLKCMVGCMTSTSLSMAPAFLVGQLCDIVDLDGPVHLKADRPVTATYADGHISCSRDLWG